MRILLSIGSFLLAFGLIGKGLFRLTRLLRNKSSNLKLGELGKYYKGSFDSKMSKREAILILNIRDGLSKEEIKDAHRKMLVLNHPDNGGSTYIASKINEAKEVLSMNASEKIKKH